jgi:predicted transcriptional regulator
MRTKANVTVNMPKTASKSTDPSMTPYVSEGRQIALMAMEYVLNNKPLDLEELSHRIEQFYSTIDEDRKNYFMGFYSSLLNMIRAKHLTEMDRTEAKRCVEKSKYVIPILNALKERPGITHGELSVVLGIKINQLSNLMPAMRVDQLVSEAKEGREKHYFITQKGLRVMKNHSIDHVSIDVSRIMLFDDPFQPETFQDIFHYNTSKWKGVPNTR